MPSNDVSAKITLRDLDLILEGQTLKILLSLKLWELAKNGRNDFDRFEYLPTNDIIGNVTLTYFFKVKNVKWYYLGNIKI